MCVRACVLCHLCACAHALVYGARVMGSAPAELSPSWSDPCSSRLCPSPKWQLAPTAKSPQRSLLSNVPIGAFRSFCEPFGAFWSLFGAFLITELFGAFRSFSAHQVAKGRPLCCIGHGRTRAPQPRRRSRAQLSERRSAILPRRLSRRTAAFGRQSCGTEGTRVLIRTLQPLHARSQLRGRCERVY